jgi:hypothetical protein
MLPILHRRLLTIAITAFATLVLHRIAHANGPELQTPILLSVQDAPVPFTGSDARTHLVYELWLTNFSSAEATIEQVQVLGDGGAILQDLQPAQIARQLQPAGQRDSTATLAKGTQALLFLNIILDPGAKPPTHITHRVTAQITAAPPGHLQISVDGALTQPNLTPPVHIGPPLRGDLYLSADSCCDAVRHSRAALPVNNRIWIAQRFAVDWEQLDASGRIYSGPREALKSYTIFAKPALAVADAIVESTTDRYQEQIPGKFPANISLDQADGNSVILDLGNHRFALYAHLQPGSITVHRGQRVKTGQVLGLVGNTGNSLAPHLHFHVMDGPSPLASNGLPYVIDNFKITAKSPGTESFDAAEADGTPLATIPITPAQPIQAALPLDQLVISFNP